MTGILLNYIASGELQNTLSPLPHITPGFNTVQRLFDIFISVTASIAVLVVVLAGFKYITSSGDPQGVATARKAIIYALVGLAVCLSAWSIVTIVVKGL